MEKDKKRYLELFEDNGGWISQPGYKVVAAISTPEYESALHFYDMMIKEDMLHESADHEGVSGFAQGCAKLMKKDARAKVFAGEVAIELARREQKEDKPVALIVARSDVAEKHVAEFKGGTLGSIQREVERAFAIKAYRNTAHLQAAYLCLHAELGSSQKSLEGIINSESTLRKFLGCAKFFEKTIDRSFESGRAKWNPFRVPQGIAEIKLINL